MKFDKKDNFLGLIASSLIDESKGESKGKCPADEEIALYFKRELDKARKEALLAHFVFCEECQEKLRTPEEYSYTDSSQPGFLERFLASLRRPFVGVPVAALILVLLFVSFNGYLNSPEPIPERYEERYRGSILVAPIELELTSSLLETIKEDNKEELKEKLIKNLPPGSEVSHIFVEDRIKYLNQTDTGKQVVLLLYNNGLLKVKLK